MGHSNFLVEIQRNFLLEMFVARKFLEISSRKLAWAAVIFFHRKLMWVIIFLCVNFVL